ncbi:hypothetical protein PAI11_34570 [Patulibacter medicamentivorans]|uniref:Uncharacterized protein n=1 Tax=Patulibacter medicamentivorans TaxID=1097667 RepID=H0E9E0_9ACTN|nr:hypothetical protein PAI11_34570 [Patulibacter medicamentivorans]
MPGSATIACPPAGGPRPCRRLRTTLAAQPPRPLAELADALGVRWAILETATACSLRVGLRCRGIPLAAARRESLRTHVRGPAPSSIGYGVIAVRAAP